MGERAALVPAPAEAYVPPIIPAPALAQEQWTQARFSRWMGGVALQGATAGVELPTSQPESTSGVDSLHESVRRIKLGEHSSADIAMVRLNAHKALSEELYKSGHITEITAEFEPDGSLRQHSQDYDSVYRNSLEQPSTPLMQTINTIFARNWHRQEDLARSGMLKTHWMITFALAPETAEDVIENNFFYTTLALSAQGHTMVQDHDGSWIMETKTAFAAGMPPLEEDPTRTEQERLKQLTQAMAHRHDIRAIKALLQEWGVEGAEHMTIADILDTPICIPKTRMPNGITDIVAAYDQKVGGNAFFGSFEEGSRDYQEHERVCRTREQHLEKTVDSIVAELIEKSDPTANMNHTNELLSGIVFGKALAQAVKDNTIDIRNFNVEARHNIVQARQAWASGNIHDFLAHAGAAAANAYSLVCNVKTEGVNDSVMQALAKALGVPVEELKDPNDPKNWEKHRGKCRREECENHQKETWVGPCDVCDDCQEKFNFGKLKE